jgi:hypothetical protein
MRKGCLISITVTLCIITLVLLATRSQTIERGLRLASFESGDFTYSAWSYGNWIESKHSGVHVSTYAPPYTIVVAVQPHQSRVETIELLSATITGRDGVAYSVLDQIGNTVEKVELRSSSVVGSPYAAFTFEWLFESNDDAALNLIFRVNSKGDSKTFTQTLEIIGFEEKKRSFTFLEAISGV